MIISLTALKIFRTNQVDRHRLLVVCALPFVIWVAVIGAVAGVNRAVYGIFATVEFKSRDFLAAYGALSRVKHLHWQPYYPLPRETRERIYKISPAFAELAPSLEGNVGAAWTLSSCEGASLCDDISGGWFMWALRDAVAAAGYHSSGATAANYYRRLATEINAACARGQIECGAERASMMLPWHSEHTRPLVNTLLRGAVFLSRFDGFQADPSPSTGTKESLILFRDLTSSRLSRGATRQLQIRGWAFVVTPSSSVELSVRAADGTLADATVKRLRSPDVYRHFLSAGKNFPNAREARFEITTSCTDGCSLHLKAGDRPDEQIPLDGSIRGRETLEPFFYLDAADYAENDFLPRQSKIDNIKISILNRIGRGYQAIVPFSVVFALIGYIMSTINILRTKIAGNFWLINTVLLMAIGIRLLILSIIDVTSFPGINILYLSPAYPLLLIFVTLALAIRYEKRF
jgi:hypothetical protein